MAHVFDRVRRRCQKFESVMFGYHRIVNSIEQQKNAKANHGCGRGKFPIA